MTRQELEARKDQLLAEGNDPKRRQRALVDPNEERALMRLVSKRMDIESRLERMPEEPAEVEEDNTPEEPFADRRAKLTAKLGELQERRAALSLDVLTDESVGRELAETEADIAETEQQIERLGLAGAEKDRRDAEAEAKAAEDAAEKARKQCQKLQKTREKEAAAVDKALADLVTSLESWFQVASEQESLRKQIPTMRGGSAAPAPGAIDSAVKHATLGRPRLAMGGLTEGLLPAVKPRPLAEADAKLFEAK